MLQGSSTPELHRQFYCHELQLVDKSLLTKWVLTHCTFRAEGHLGFSTATTYQRLWHHHACSYRIIEREMSWQCTAYSYRIIEREISWLWISSQTCFLALTFPSSLVMIQNSCSAASAAHDEHLFSRYSSNASLSIVPVMLNIDNSILIQFEPNLL